MEQDYDIDQVRSEATKARMDWNEGHKYANWRSEIGSCVRAIWHTLTDEQKIAIACDAKRRAREEEEAAELNDA
jgi:hypothetical protein